VAVNLLDMCQAYSAFARDGSTVKPRFILTVKSAWGEDLYDSRPEATVVMTPQTAYIMASMLKEVVRAGTATAARVFNRPMAGKTGTTNDFQDAWFMGFTPYLLTGVYIGYDQPRSMGNGETGGGRPAHLDRLSPGRGERLPGGGLRAAPGHRHGRRGRHRHAFKEGTERGSFAKCGRGDRSGCCSPIPTPPWPGARTCSSRCSSRASLKKYETERDRHAADIPWPRRHGPRRFLAGDFCAVDAAGDPGRFVACLALLAGFPFLATTSGIP
jgi:membrane peptidoglycan carboxypeptidase